MISRHDEDMITWYWLHGARQFQRSTHGAMVTRLILDSMGSCRCRVCGGVGILEDDAAVRRHVDRGKRTEMRHRWRLVARRGEAGEDRLVNECVEVGIGSYCQLCAGTGSVPQKEPTRRCEYCERLDEEPLEAWRQRRRACSWCLGTGTARVTALPVHHAGRDEPKGFEVEGHLVERFGMVSRRLECMSPRHRKVLELYYGPVGHSWADQPGGRLIALQEFTPAGRSLLRRTRVKGDEATLATASERLAAQRMLQTTAPTTWRRDLLARAEVEAAELHQSAVRAWQSALGWRRDFQALRREIDRTGRAYADLLDGKTSSWED